MNPDLFSPTDLAEYLGVPVSTLKYWRMRGGGPRWLKMANGRHIRYRRADVDKWLGEQAADLPVRRRRRVRKAG